MGVGPPHELWDSEHVKPVSQDTLQCKCALESLYTPSEEGLEPGQGAGREQIPLQPVFGLGGKPEDLLRQLLGRFRALQGSSA